MDNFMTSNRMDRWGKDSFGGERDGFVGFEREEERKEGFGGGGCNGSQWRRTREKKLILIVW